MKYIVEARSEHFPSLYSMSEKGMVECEKHQAARFNEETARRVASSEKKLRPHRRIMIIKVTD